MLLKFKDVYKNNLAYYRQKTINTSRRSLKPVQVHLTDLALSLIDKYKIPKPHPENYIFDILSNDMDAETQRRHIYKFNRYINQHIKTFAERIGIPTEISVMFCRHSFATHVRNFGGSTEMIRELLNHSTVKVTEGYLAKLPEDGKKNFLDRMFHDTLGNSSNSLS